MLLVVVAGCVENDPEPQESEAADPIEVTAQMDALLEQLGAGQPVTLPAEPAYLLDADPRNAVRDVTLELEPSNMLEGAWFEVDGVPQEMPAMWLFEGHAAGDEDAEARLTVTPAWARGTVRIDDVSYRIRINMEGNFPVGTELRDDYESAAYPADLALPAPTTFDKDGQEPHDCLSPVPDTASPQTNIVGPSDNEGLVARIILDADRLYLDTLGNHSAAMMVAMLAEVDAIYDHQIGMRFQIMGLHIHTNATAMSDPADAAPLGDLAAYWNARSDLRDMVHLYTGYPSSYAQANCIGGAGMPDLAYTFTTIHWAAESSGKMRHEQTYAHELGHILNAHHHYGNPVEGGLSTTVMHQGGEKVHPSFSLMSKSVIRGWSEAHLGQHDP